MLWSRSRRERAARVRDYLDHIAATDGPPAVIDLRDPSELRLGTTSGTSLADRIPQPR